MSRSRLGVRWTVGDVSPWGFEALRLSIWGAHHVFGDAAAYAVCVNTIPVEEVRTLTGHLPADVIWYDATNDLPAFLREHFDDGMAEGVGWKLAPMRFFPDRYELSLDNDCILWEEPAALRSWREQPDGRTCLAAEDVVACFGQFEPLCGSAPRNGGLRGLPPGFDFEAAMKSILADYPVRLTSELDEQGLQAAALARECEPYVVPLQDVTICSPFYPHLPHLGRCGAHFVGLNARHIPWDYYDRPADDWKREHWSRHRSELYRRTAAPAPDRNAAPA